MINEHVAKIQGALFMKGYLVGEVDGIWGRRTIAALKAFQENEHLAEIIPAQRQYAGGTLAAMDRRG